MDDLSPLQRRVVLVGWITYAAYYLGRVNLAAALPAMEAEFGWTPEQTSLLAGAMLWTYAAGQLINGWLGDRLTPRHMVFVGIVGSSIVNLLMASVTALELLVLLTLVNGFLQAMGWGPILRTLSETLADGQRRRIAGVFGTSYIVGNTATWLLTGLLLSQGFWQSLFIIPPLLMLGFGFIWYRLSTSGQWAAQNRPAASGHVPAQIRLKEFWVFLFTALVAGALLNGALFYAPTFAALNTTVDQAAITAVVFPIFGLIGTVGLSSIVLRSSRGQETWGLIVLLALAAAGRGIALLLPSSTLSTTLLLSVMGVTSYALTNLLLTAVPLLYAHLGTSRVAGIMDATHSIGGALGSTLVGLLLVHGGWSGVYGAWVVLPLIAILFVAAGSRGIKLLRV
ncbi:MAG: MFS transporter [Anaerolineae bacterium]|nr:MFS transporter [Anaerolineae bacterium]